MVTASGMTVTLLGSLFFVMRSLRVLPGKSISDHIRLAASLQSAPLNARNLTKSAQSLLLGEPAVSISMTNFNLDDKNKQRSDEGIIILSGGRIVLRDF
jgi:hypothetical protein